MALTFTSRLNQRQDDASGTFTVTTSSFTLSSDCLAVAVIGAVNNANLLTANSTLVSTGLTWTKQVSQEDTDGATYRHVFEIWTAPVSTGGSFTATWENSTNNAGDAHCAISISDFTGYSVADPIGETAGGHPGNDGAQSITLSGTPATNSIVIAGLLREANSGDITTTHGTDWTEVIDPVTGGTTGYACLQVQYKLNVGSTTVPWQDVDVAGGNVYSSMVSAGAIEVKSGDGELTPSLFSNTNTFYSPLIPGPSGDYLLENGVDRYLLEDGSGVLLLEGDEDVGDDLQPPLYSDGDTFFSPTVGRGAVDLSPALYTDGDTFFSPNVGRGLVPSLYSDADTFFSPTVSPGAVNLSPALYSDADAFHSPTVAASNALAPSLYADGDTFFAPTVAAAGATQDLAPDLFSDGDAFFSPEVVNVGGGADAPTITGGGGGLWFSRRKVEDDWRKRKKKLEELEEIIKRAAGQIPADVPEAQVVKAAVAKVEAAVDALDGAPTPYLPPFNTAELVSAVNRVQQALHDYKVRKAQEYRRRLEEDDEDVLLLLEDD